MKGIVDLHCDSVKFLMAGADLRQPNPKGHVDLPRLEDGGIGIQVFAAFLSSSVPEESSFSCTLEMLETIDGFAASDGRLVKIVSADDCRRALAGKKVGILSAVENGQAIENSLEKLRILRERGVRILTLVHSRHLGWAASCTGDPAGKEAGLSNFGKDVVREMNTLGMIVDVSHSAESTFWDVARTSKKPFIASHSSAHALCSSPRNLKDDQIKAVADSGGIVGACFFPPFLSDRYRIALDETCGDIFAAIDRVEKENSEDPVQRAEAHTRMNERLAERLSSIRVPLSLVADHIDHMVGLVGDDFVGLGSDFDGVFSLPDGVTGCDVYPALETELRGRGYSETSLVKIFRENFLRVLEAQER